jgi:hypothetical protein
MRGHGQTGCSASMPEVDVSVFSRLLLALYLLEAGLLLVITPWSRFWDRNYCTALWPWLALVMGNAYMKGAVSGVGLISVLAALGELMGLLSRSSDDAASIDGQGA